MATNPTDSGTDNHDSTSRIETLARVDERTKSMQADLTQFRQDVNKSLGDIGTQIKDSENRNKENFTRLETNLDTFKAEANSKFVKKEEFEPIKKVVYTILYITGAAVLAGILSLLLHSNMSVIIK